MNRTTVRKMATLGVGVSMLAGVLATVGPASATVCYRMVGGFLVSYTCANPPIVLPTPTPTPTPTPPPPPTPTPTPGRVATKLALLTKAGTVSGPVTVTISAKLTDLPGNARTSTPVILCWRAVTVSRESCAARTTNSAGVAAVAVKVSTATVVRAVANATATYGASISASAVVRVIPKVTATPRVRSLTASVNPASRVKVLLQKKVGKEYVNVRAAYTSTRGAISFTKLTKGTYYRVYVYASPGRNAVYSCAVRVR